MRQTRVIKHSYYVRQKPVNAKKGEAARPPPSSSHPTARCRPPVSGALASHGLTSAVLSARWGLASGFGTGPGVPPMLWPLTGGRRPPLRCPVSLTCPGGRMAHRGDDSGASSCPDRAFERSVPRAARCGSGRARAISAARLRTSPPLHLPSIDQVVYLGPYRKEN